MSSDSIGENSRTCLQSFKATYGIKGSGRRKHFDGEYYRNERISFTDDGAKKTETATWSY